ncbi:MAG: Rpn family recombination-promoting nuclease/putative transposase [Caldilineaceae bacterium]|nr:Rpn family recombination-promoting nuclease/putative transposase [Caldilineaceae bacterium]
MAKAVDIGSKRLVSLAPAAWARWLTGDESIKSVELLSGEFQWVSRANDVLIKVESVQHGVFLVANEMQLKPDKFILRRLRAYASLAEERYGLLVYPVVVNILPRGAEWVQETSYHSELLGLTAHQDVRVINLWEVDANSVFEQELMTLLPFTPILYGGSDPLKIGKAVSLLREQEDIHELEPLLAFFASFVLDTQLVRNIMRWDMTILRESPWYAEILKEGLAEGRDLGYKQGIEQGEAEMIVRLLALRFGECEPELANRIMRLKGFQLALLAEPILKSITRDDFIYHLAQIERAVDQSSQT